MLKKVTSIFCTLVFFSVFTYARGNSLSANTFYSDSSEVKALLAKIDKQQSDKAKLSFALNSFQKTNGSTNEHVVAALLDVFKKHGKGSPEVINSVSLKLKESDALYRNRGPKEVERLRGFMLASLSEIGVNAQSVAIIKGELTYGYHPYVAAAAARTARLVNTNKASLIPLFSRYFDNRFIDDYVDLDNYGSFWPLKNPTSVRLEAIKTLSEIGDSDPQTAAMLLKKITEAGPATALGDEKLKVAARTALEKINTFSAAHNHVNHSEHSGHGEHSSMMHGTAAATSAHAHGQEASCCSKEGVAGNENVVWIDPGKRVLKQIADLKAIDQEGNIFDINKALGKPFVLTFFYTRCDNPTKCSATVTNLAALENDLKKEGLADKVSLFAITLDPNFDNFNQIKAYGEDRGAQFDENFKFLTFNSDLHQKLVKDLGVSVNYGAGLVNIHSTQLLFFDKKGRLAKSYDNAVWANESLVNDFKTLLKE